MRAKKFPVVALVSVAFIWVLLGVLLGVLFGVISAWSSVIGSALESMRQFTSLTALRVLFAPSHSLQQQEESAVESKDCFLNADERPLVGWSALRAQLGMPVRLDGYGVWPFWKAPFSAPSLRDDAANQIVGDMLVFHSDASVWILVTLDSLGVPASAAARLEAEIRDEVFATLQSSSPIGKVLQNV